MNEARVNRYNTIIGWLEVAGVELGQDRAKILWAGICMEGAPINIPEKIEVDKRGEARKWR